MKNIKLNNVSELESLRESINKTIDKRIAEKKLNEKIDTISGLSFIDVKSLFESISDKLFDEKSNQISNYVKTIKENKDLRTLYVLSEKVLKPEHTDNTNILVNSLVTISESLNKKEINKGVNKLKNILKESLKKANVSDEYIDSVLNENKEIKESLNFVLTNKKTASNLYEHTNNLNNVVSYINENMANNKETENKSTNELISDLNEAISVENVWESEAIKDLTMCYLSESSKEDLFNRYKSDCISLLDSKIDSSNTLEERSRFSTMKEQLSNKEFKSEKLQESILKLSELKHTLSEE